jgi:DNA-binding transcriptional MerR regulator
MEGHYQDLLVLTEADCRDGEYSAQRLADLAGITPRTLHHYDEIGLLVPALRMGNGRRLYHADQVVRLCQILWLRGLGFSLERIRAILSGPASNTNLVLRRQQKVVRQEIQRMQCVDRSIERAIQHLEGLPMSKQELECILKDSSEPQVDFEKVFDDSYGEGAWAKAQCYAETLSAEQRTKTMQGHWDWHTRFMQAVKEGLAADSAEVQALVHEAAGMSRGAEAFGKTPKEVFLLEREGLKPGSEMTKPLEMLCPGYAQLLYEAAGLYAEQRWPS